MTKRPDINRLIDFHRLLLDFGSIERMVRIPPDFEKAENDIEHSYSLAMMAWFLASYFPKLNRDALIRYALVHDLVEVHAGDTFVFGDESHLANKHERELAALERLSKDWPDFPELTETIIEYEKRDTEESKFIYALDKLMPAILNYLGEGYVWRKHNVSFEQFLAEKEKKVPISPEIYEYYEELVQIFRQNLHFFAQPVDTSSKESETKEAK